METLRTLNERMYEEVQRIACPTYRFQTEILDAIRRPGISPPPIMPRSPIVGLSMDPYNAIREMRTREQIG